MNRPVNQSHPVEMPFFQLVTWRSAESVETYGKVQKSAEGLAKCRFISRMIWRSHFSLATGTIP
jgi:hypothetical protein